MDLDTFTVEQLIQCLPENAPLYKDSGLWQILDDDTNEPVAYQHANENLKQFLIRHIEHLRAFGNESLEVDLAVAKQLHTSDEPKLGLFDVVRFYERWQKKG